MPCMIPVGVLFSLRLRAVFRRAGEANNRFPTHQSGKLLTPFFAVPEMTLIEPIILHPVPGKSGW